MNETLDNDKTLESAVKGVASVLLLAASGVLRTRAGVGPGGADARVAI